MAKRNSKSRRKPFNRPLPEIKDGERLEPQYGQVLLEPKPWYKSKTLWFNAFVATATAAEKFTPMIEGRVSNKDYGMIMLGVTAVNGLLRLATGKPVRFRRHD